MTYKTFFKDNYFHIHFDKEPESTYKYELMKEIELDEEIRSEMILSYTNAIVICLRINVTEDEKTYLLLKYGK